MLRDNHREQGGFDQVGLALQLAELLLAPVGVVRCKDDEALLGQACGVTAVELECIARGVLVDDIRRQPFQAVLANDHRPAFPGL